MYLDTQNKTLQRIPTISKHGHDVALSVVTFGELTYCFISSFSAQEIVSKFKELDLDGSGQLDPDEARMGLRQLRTATGRLLTDKEVDFFIQTAGDNGVIDLGQFTNLLYRLKLYTAPCP